MDQKSIEILEFQRIKEMLAGFTSFSASRQLALDLQPLTDHEQITVLLKQSAEARHLLTVEPDFSIGGITDIRETVRLAARNKMLEPPILVEVHQTLIATRELHSSFKKRSNELPLLWKIASGIVELRHLEKDIARCITPSGEVWDTASAQLAMLRKQLKEAREQLMLRLESMLKSPRWRRIIQEPVITEREGRHVIPVKIESRREIKGIVHDVSNTGATVFVEPWSTVELGNEVRELVAQEKHEVEKILADLSARVGAHEEEISHNIELTAELDLALAKARYARKVRATEPVIVAFGDDGKGSLAGERPGVLNLIDARHPLLSGKAVPLSIEIGRDFSVLIITGPNTGGKTVALKTIGLLSLMAQAGLPIPASAESCIPVFDSIFADIGDEQSIEQTLSTFSWHMGNIVRIIEHTTEKSLVLLDELGTSTDPGEGSALARSILLHFLSRGTMTVATTHFGDLKAFAHTTPGIENASLDFDPVTLAPTYHLTMGIPGGSNALATAARLGLSPEILSRAKDMLPKGSQEMEALLADLLSEKHELDTLRRNLEREGDETARLRAELENELKQVRTEERRLIQETRDRVVHDAAELQKELRQAATELKKAKTKERIEQARKALAAVWDELKSQAWQPPVSAETREEPEDSRIAPGDTVWLKEANLYATVLSVSEETREIEVQAGSTRLRLSLDSVEKVKPPDGEAAPPPAPLRATSRHPVPLELDLRGKRADEVDWALDSYLNGAAMANLNEVRIVHGIGTGTVRRIARDILASHPLVKSFRSGGQGEGGDGATIVRL